MSGRLTLVGTPIGNLSDLSPRAVEALRACDFIAAEDTRVTLKLLNHFGIQKPLVSYFEHNKRERGGGHLRPGCCRGRTQCWLPTRACPPSLTPAKSWWTCAMNGRSRWGWSPAPRQ